MESSTLPAPAPVVAAQGSEDGGGGRPKRRLTQEEIEYVMAIERRPFRPPGLDLFARQPQGEDVLECIARAAELVEKIQDVKMEYKERVLWQYAAKGYVELTDNEDDDDDEKEDEEWEGDMVF